MCLPVVGVCHIEDVSIQAHRLKTWVECDALTLIAIFKRNHPLNLLAAHTFFNFFQVDRFTTLACAPVIDKKMCKLYCKYFFMKNVIYLL